MSENQQNDSESSQRQVNNEISAKKLKNKKKDIIQLGPNTVTDQQAKLLLTKNFDDKTIKQLKEEREIKKENKISNQPLSSTLPKNEVNLEEKVTYLDIDRNNLFLIEKLLLELQLLLSLNDVVDEKLVKILAPLLGINHFNSILEERNCRKICGNFFCGRKIHVVFSKSLKYDEITNEFTNAPIMDMFCDKKCYEEYSKLRKMSGREFRIENLLKLENITLFKSLRVFFEDNPHISRINNLAENLLDTHIRHHKEKKESIEKEVRNYLKKISEILLE